jgi:ribosome-associated toxin RatA of RatAB toxin-antitoxin module
VTTRRFEATEQMRATPKAAFEWISDFRNVPKVLDGVTRWEPLTRQTSGPGARFDVEMRTLGVPLTSELEVVVWDPPRRLGWSSRGGLIKQEGAWTIVKRREEVLVTLRIEYEPPAAALGNLLAGPVESLARQRLQRALQRMAEELEGRRR